MISDEIMTLISNHEDIDKWINYHNARATEFEIERARVRNEIRAMVVERFGVGIEMKCGIYTLMATDLGLSIRDKAMTDKLNDHARVAEQLWDDE